MTATPTQSPPHQGEADLVISQLRLLSGETTNIVISDGHIVAFTSEPVMATRQTFDAGGRVALPALVDVHTHLDKTLTGQRSEFRNDTGGLEEAITRWQAQEAHLSQANVYRRARRALMMARAHGTCALRSHVDVSPRIGLRSVEALLQLRDAFKGEVTLELVALGLLGIDRKTDQLMHDALALGVDVVGGCPWVTPEPEAAIRAAFTLAERYGKALDLHVDETEDPNVRTLETIAEYTTACGMQGQVNVGHCVSLAAVPMAEARLIIEKVAKAKLSVTTLPSVNLVLQGRKDPGRRGLTRVKALLDAGVRVCAASDNVQDPFNPLGNYNLLWTANLLAHAAHLTSPQEQRAAIELVSAAPAEVMGFPTGITVGAPASFVMVDHREPETLLATMPAVHARVLAGALAPSQRTSGGEGYV